MFVVGRHVMESGRMPIMASHNDHCWQQLMILVDMLGQYVQVWLWANSDWWCLDGQNARHPGPQSTGSWGPRSRNHTPVLHQHCVVGAGSDSVCLAAGVLLWRGGLSAGRLTQTIAATWVRIPVMAPTTFGTRSACVDCELIVLHYSCLEFLSGCP